MILKLIRDWSEVWALLIPLAIILLYAPFESRMRPIIIYVWIGLIISIVSTVLYFFHNEMPPLLKSNNLVYNIHSFVRVLLFSWYILQGAHSRGKALKNILIGAYLVFVPLNFILWESILKFSNTHFIAESIVLLILCINFFLHSMQDEGETDWVKHPTFLVCTGIMLYEAINFFTFLFFYLLSEKYLEFLRAMWTLHNITFVLLCSILAVALFRSRSIHKTRSPKHELMTPIF